MPALPTKDIEDNKYPVSKEKKASIMTTTKFLFREIVFVKVNKRSNRKN
jgi:hypothetical protein